MVTETRIRSAFFKHAGREAEEMSGSIIVKKAIFESFLSTLDSGTSRQLMRLIPLMPPGLEDAQFSDWVKDSREILGLTQEELAVKAGVSQTALSDLERQSDRSFGRKRKSKIVEALRDLVLKAA